MFSIILFSVNALLWCSAVSENCQTPLRVTSKCVLINDCPELLSVVQQSSRSIEDVQFLRNSSCGFDKEKLKVCCGPRLRKQAVIINSATESLPGTTKTTPLDKADAVQVEDSFLSPRNECGIDTNGDRIIGGNVTNLDEFRWMALLGYEYGGELTFNCGGTLINKRYVLTAAHCVVNRTTVNNGELTIVRLGEYNTQSVIDCVDDDCADPVLDVLVHSTYIHPDYYYVLNRVKLNDIALIRLAKRVTFTDFIQPICLADVNSSDLVPGDVMTISGWGQRIGGLRSDIKRKLRIPIFNKTECIKKFRARGFYITFSQICAGGVFNEDACQGDSGGPLMRMAPPGVWEEVGVISFGYSCGWKGWPAIYTSVSGYLSWIISTLRSSNV